MITRADVSCHCGKWSGERCEWTGPESETVLVAYIPDALRGTAQAAHTRSGLERTIRVERSCAARMVETDGEWVEAAVE